MISKEEMKWNVFFLDCQKIFGESLVPEQMICSGEEGKDSCTVRLLKIPKELNF